MKVSRRYLVAMVLLAVFAVGFGVFGTFAPPLAEEGSPIQPQQESSSESVGHFMNPPTYDSGWVDIQDKQGQYFSLNHNLNTTQVFVDISGKQTLDYTDGPVALTKTYGGIDDDSCYGMIQTSEDAGYALVGTTASFGAGGYDFWLVKVDSCGIHQWNKTYGGTGDDVAMSFLRTSDGGYLLAGSTTSVGAGGADFYLVRTDESGNLLWARPYGGLEDDVARFVIQTGDGGYAVAGSTRSKGAGGNDFWLIKTDSFGNPQWDNVYGGTGFDVALSVAQTRDDGYAIAGNTWSSGAGGADFLLVKANSVGTEQWNKTYGGTRDDVARSVIQTKDERFVLAGTTTSYGAGRDDFWLIETDAVGTVHWNKTYGGPQMDTFRALAETRDNGYVLFGYTNSSGAGSFDFWLAKTDLSGNMLWSETYGGASDDYGYAAVQTYDGGYALAGITVSYGAGGPDFFLVKKDSAITKQWYRNYGGTGGDYIKSMVQTSDGGFLLAGSTSSYGAGNDDSWLVKTDSVGNLIWNKTYGGTADDWATSVVLTGDGGYAFAGVTESYGAGDYDFWLVKTDSCGDVQWNQTYGGTFWDNAYSLVHTSDGGYALAGYTDSFGIGGYADFWLVKTDGFGNEQWNKTYGGTENDAANSLVQTSDGGYAMAGYTYSFGAGKYDFWLVKTDGFGNEQWNQTYGATDDEVAFSIVQTKEGGFALAGYTASYGVGGQDFWLVKTDGFGNEQWNQTYGGALTDFAYSLVQTSDGGYALAGYTTSYSDYWEDSWLVKTDRTGIMQWSQTSGRGASQESATSIVQTSDGGYALGGYTTSYDTVSDDFWLVKIKGEMNLEHQRNFDTAVPINGWSKTFGGTNDDVAWSLIQTSDGGYALAGSYRSGIGFDLFSLVKFDGFGNELWSRVIGIEGAVAHSLIQTSDGGYALAGSVNSSGAGGDDFWLVKFDSSGNELWNKTYGGIDDDVAWSLVQTSDAGYALGGSTRSDGAGSDDFWLVKTDGFGNEQWNQTYGGTKSDVAHSLVQTGDAGFALAGSTIIGVPPVGHYDLWFVRTDASGNELWSQQYGGTSNDIAYSLIQTSDGGYALAGFTESYSAESAFWLVKTDCSGYAQWNRTFGGKIRVDVAWSLVQTGDGGYALAGSTSSFGAGSLDFWLVKTGDSGDLQWSHTYGGVGDDVAHSIVQASDGGYVLAGSTGSFGAGNLDFWLVKTDTESGLTRTGLTDNSITLYRGKTDPSWNYVRVRIWTIKEPSWIYGDLNMDGVVDNKDLYIIGRNYGKTFSLLSLTGIVAVASIHTIKTRKQQKSRSKKPTPTEPLEPLWEAFQNKKTKK